MAQGKKGRRVPKYEVIFSVPVKLITTASLVISYRIFFSFFYSIFFRGRIGACQFILGSRVFLPFNLDYLDYKEILGSLKVFTIQAWAVKVPMFEL